jgi:photosystem II stability/assembly factor-like uncharacterized protein
MNSATRVAAVCSIALVSCGFAATTAGVLSDVLDRPALQSPIAAKRLLLSVAVAGDRLVAVGPRGHIVVSADAGTTWQQAAVPVSSDLTAVYFPSAKIGWAVGHDGVVLSTTDGGTTWMKQLDGRDVNELVLADIQLKRAAHPESTLLQGLAAEAERNKELGPDKPFLDVWFENDSIGYVVGAYGLLLKTQDGGRTWQSWFDRQENPRLMSLYSIRPAAGGLYIAGEGGTVLRLDPSAQRFVAAPVDYVGTLFGVADADGAVLVYGLRGNAFRSADGGRNWTKVNAMLPATIVGGTSLAPGNVVLADQGGRLAVSNDGGRTFNLIPQTNAGASRLAGTGPFGVMVVAADTPR